MFSSRQQIIGVQRVLQTTNAGQTWNNKKIRWSIVYNINNQSKPYDIELQMVLVSAKRIVKVNQQIKDTQMCSFGYYSKFDISQKLKGQIKQDSLTFQLFINGQTFTKLQQTNKSYEPPKIRDQIINKFDPIQQKTRNRHNQFDMIKNKQQKPLQKNVNLQNNASFPIQKGNPLVKSMEYQPQLVKNQIPQLKHKQISTQTKQDKKFTQTTLKNTQSELIRILMEEKKRKKEQQLVKSVQL